jgi:hypothetical protein
MSLSFPEVQTATVDVSENDSQSTVIEIGTGHVVAVFLPTIDSSSVGFEASVDGSTWRTVNDASGSAIEISATTGDECVVFGTKIIPGPYLRLTFGSSQTSDRTVEVVVQD